MKRFNTDVEYRRWSERREAWHGQPPRAYSATPTGVAQETIYAPTSSCHKNTDIHNTCTKPINNVNTTESKLLFPNLNNGGALPKGNDHTTCITGGEECSSESCGQKGPLCQVQSTLSVMHHEDAVCSVNNTTEVYDASQVPWKEVLVGESMNGSISTSVTECQIKPFTCISKSKLAQNQPEDNKVSL